ncbi:nitrate reductase [Limnohabitans sp. B9-3]|uniref:nitrate reductase n=1 Tax=Limnohabitans sp. B9-3 TaxID=1100707 RepID=UPI000C1F3680|nr:nitrate reductase [Limnohabitans sp. B9-3]PIT75390.1 nitrate reductase [Limnohabitans sp. B9-3]
MKETRSTCPYCGVGCGVIIESNAGQITGVRGDPAHPANFGRLCSKGSTLHLTASPVMAEQTRLLQPMRRLVRGGSLQPMAWDNAMQLASQTLASIVRAHGADALGFYVSGQLLTEDYYVFNKLAKGLLGTNNIDTNSRLCMSSAVAGYKLTLGADAPPACYDDVMHANCLFIAGSNAAYAHPVLFRRIEDARAKNPNLKIIVADPRRTDTASSADLHLQLQPGTDVTLFHGMLHVMLAEGWVDTAYIAAHTEGFEALQNLVADYTPARVHDVCGITPEQLLQATRWFAGVPPHSSNNAPDPKWRTLSLYCQGLNQSSSGTAKNASLINLHLATAQIGKAGAGPFSLTGQPNAMGGREVGGLANLISAHRDMSKPEHRAEVAALWGIDDVPSKPGKTAVEMFEAAADGEIKALWIACTNPAQSMPDQATVRRALERAEFVVVQEAFATAETCDFADLLLPATTWGEKEGTVTNSERRITRVRAAVPAPGQAKHDWQIVVDLAARLREEPGVAAHATPSLTPSLDDAHATSNTPPRGLHMAYTSPEEIWVEHRESTRGRDLDITGLSYAHLEHTPEQWPMREGAAQGQARLYEDGVFATANGRAKFAALPYVPTAEARESRFPFSLNTGRLRDQWHGMTRTSLVGKLFGHVAEPVVQLHPDDMARLDLTEGGLVHVTSKRGSIVVPAQASSDLGAHQAFIAMHWGPAFLSGRDHQNKPLAGVNAITTSAYCPSSKQPELKHAAVKVLKAELPWTLLAVAWLPEDKAQTILQALRARMVQFEFASCVPFSGDATSDGQVKGPACQGVLMRAACSEAPNMALLHDIEKLLGLNGIDSLRYIDAKHGQLRSLRLKRQQLKTNAGNNTGATSHTQLDAFVIAGDTSAETWLKALLQTQASTQDFGRRLLMTGNQPPVALVDAGATVCACVGVKDVAIQAHLKAGQGDENARLATLQDALKCGTQCGSCVPELRRMIRLTLSSDAPAASLAL